MRKRAAAIVALCVTMSGLVSSPFAQAVDPKWVDCLYVSDARVDDFRGDIIYSTTVRTDCVTQPTGVNYVQWSFDTQAFDCRPRRGSGSFLFPTKFSSGTVKVTLRNCAPGTYRPTISLSMLAGGYSSTSIDLPTFTVSTPRQPALPDSVGPPRDSEQTPSPSESTPTNGDSNEILTDSGLPYGLYSRGGKGETCFTFPNGDEDDECIKGNRWGYRVCYASARGLKVQVLRAGDWVPVKGKFARNDGCEEGSYTWTLNLELKETTSGKTRYRVINPAQAGFKRNVMKINVTHTRD